VFTVPFEFFENSDLKVYKNSTLLTLTTNYTVTGAGVTNGGSITLVSGATAGDILTIVRDVPVKRVTDFPTSGPFNVDALNSDLDRLTAMVQQQEALDSRSLRLDQFDTPNSLNTLPAKADRVGRVLQFNSSTGQPEVGPTTSEVANAQTYATNALASQNAAASSASAASTSASNASTSATNAASSASAASTSASNASSSASAASTSASNASSSASAASTSATAAAGSASTASTQASNASSSASAASTSASNASTSASNAASSASAASSSASAASASQIAAAASAAAAAASYDSFDDRYLGVKASDPTVDNDGNALVSGALYYNSTTATMKVYDGANWIAATSAGNTSLLNYRYVATAGQTTFSGADANSTTLSYAPNNIIVSRNGVVLDPTDYTATSGTSVVLVNAATVGDNINIVAFKSFTTADMVPASTGGTFSGNVGIGSTPSNILDIRGASSPQITLNNTSATSNDSTDVTLGTFGGTTSYWSRLNYNASQHIWKTYSTERMRIDSSGNVGIGTTTTYGFKQAINAGSSTSGQLVFGSGTGVYTNWSDGSATNSPAIGGVGNNLVFATGATTNAERMRIDSSGNLLVGTTSANVTSAVGMRLIDSGARLEVAATYSTNSNIGFDMYSTGAGAYRFYVGYGGTIYATSTTITAISDQRLKENIQDIDVGLDAIMSLKPRKFDWKAGKGKDKKGDRGWIAQEFEQVFPDMIDTWADPAPEGEEPYKAVNADLIPVLVKAIQELSAKNDALEARLAILEGATQ
jgi:hypothetical protein